MSVKAKKTWGQGGVQWVGFVTPNLQKCGEPLQVKEPRYLFPVPSSGERLKITWRLLEEMVKLGQLY